MSEIVPVGATRDRLAAVRAQRPKRRNILVATLTAICASVSGVAGVASFFAPTALPVALVSGAVAIWYWRPARRWRRWLKRFDGVRIKERVECSVAQLPGAVTLRYRVLMEAGIERLVCVPFPPHVTLRPKPPVVFPGSDDALGLIGTIAERALLGSTLRAHAPRWFTDGQLVIDNGEARMRIGKGGFDLDDPELMEVIAAVAGYGQRLGDRVAALIEMACDLTRPFDAARALAALDVVSPERVQAATARLRATSQGAACARIVLHCDHLTDPALDWATRAAIVCGALGVERPGRAQLIEAVRSLRITNPEAGMAAVDMLEAAHLVLRERALLTRRDRYLSQLEIEAGPECLAWLQARARRDRSQRRRLGQIAARIQQEHGGQLALDVSAFEGSLSDARAGEVTLVEDPPHAP